MRSESTPVKPLRISASARPTKRIIRQACTYALMFAVVLVLAAATTPAQAQTLHVLYNFAGGSDGATPSAPLIDVKGQLYSTTTVGGITGACPGVNSHGCGTVFQLTPPSTPGGAWTENVIYRFQGGSNDGANPENALIADHAGNLYGTTSAGGMQSCSGGCGTVFELQPPSLPSGAWTETVLYLFKGVPSGNGNGDAASPNTLVFDKSGNLFGMASGGGHCTTNETGTYCYGAVYNLIAPSGSGDRWTEHILFRFTGPSGAPQSAIFDHAGNLYGSAAWGKYGYGMIFTLQPSAAHRGSWVVSEIYNFKDGTDGAFVVTGLVFDASGNLYGSTLGGGLHSPPGDGTVFRLTPPAQSGAPWGESVLYAFTGGSDGAGPSFGPIVDSSGNVYGTTTEGGTAGLGTLFELNAEGQETTLLGFARTDGVNPSGLLRDPNGNLYGTAQAGGTANHGTVFKLTP